MGWDSKYSEGHNQRRRDRYAQDSAYREEQKKRAAEARARNRDGDGNLLKELNGVMVRVYKISEIAAACGVTVTRVRSAFARGRLPESSFGGKHIYVTLAQLELIKKSFKQSSVNDLDMRMGLEEDW